MKCNSFYHQQMVKILLLPEAIIFYLYQKQKIKNLITNVFICP